MFVVDTSTTATHRLNFDLWAVQGPFNSLFTNAMGSKIYVMFHIVTVDYYTSALGHMLSIIRIYKYYF